MHTCAGTACVKMQAAERAVDPEQWVVCLSGIVVDTGGANTSCVSKPIIFNTEFIIFNTEFIILIQNASFLIQNSSFLIQNSTSCVCDRPK